LLQAALQTLVTAHIWNAYIVGVVCSCSCLWNGGSVPRTPSTSPSADPRRCPYARRPGVCSEPAHRHRYLAQSALR